jgi:hypothetical protein
MWNRRESVICPIESAPNLERNEMFWNKILLLIFAKLVELNAHIRLFSHGHQGPGILALAFRKESNLTLLQCASGTTEPVVHTKKLEV